MSDVINLRQHRKAKARVTKDKLAEANRFKHGRTKAEKKLETLEAKRAERHIEGHKREKEDDDSI